MRLIQLDDHATVEIWPGRRLFLGNPDGMSLVTLPKSAMSVSLTNQKSGFIYFGSAARSTVQISGSKAKGRLMALADALVEMERPDNRVALP